MVLKFLLVEDDADLVTLVRLSLRARWPGCRVAVAGDGPAALRAFAAEAPDAIILDAMLPPPDGFEVCRRIRRASRVPILMLTARDTLEDRDRALALGADAYLTKPFQWPKLRDQLLALLPAEQARGDGGVGAGCR